LSALKTSFYAVFSRQAAPKYIKRYEQALEEVSYLMTYQEYIESVGVESFVDSER